jgi:hypothetical protein
VAHVDEAGGERSEQAVDHRPASSGIALLEGEEVDLEDLVCHGPER